jgi:hypothetical protein
MIRSIATADRMTTSRSVRNIAREGSCLIVVGQRLAKIAQARPGHIHAPMLVGSCTSQPVQDGPQRAFAIDGVVPSNRDFGWRFRNRHSTARGRKLLPMVSRYGELAEDVRKKTVAGDPLTQVVSVARVGATANASAAN